jgi:PAS domain S-box-containing protein
MPLAYILFDADLCSIDWNPAAERIFGYTKTESLGMRPRDLVPPAFWEKGSELLAWIRAGDMAAYSVNENLTKDGRTIICEWFNTRLTSETDQFVGLLCLAQDITARREAEESLRLRDRAIQAVTQGILITDPSQPDNPIVYASPGLLRLTGYGAEEVIGRNCRFLQGRGTDQAAVARVRLAIQIGEPCTVELLNYRKDGTEFWNELSISPVRDDAGRVTHFVGVQADVTARRSLEEQFRQAQKMEAIGRLAGGVAHDFNNLLTVINGYSELLIERLSTSDASRELVVEINKAGERSAGLTRQLLAFSRQQILAPQILDLNEVVNETDKMLRRMIGEDIGLSTTLAPDLWTVLADPGQIEQVLMNLAVNARDAMPTGGQLMIQTRNVQQEQASLQTHLDTPSGPHVLLSITDTGSGMPPEVKARIFEPFFTTKGERGTGLGLATVHGIIRQAGGHLSVDSEVGRGTSFKVYLPRAVNRPPTSRIRAEQSMMKRGGETILLVEDEDGVRGLACRVLRSCGYTVLETSDGISALRVAEECQKPIDLLVTDVVMPRMGGHVMAERLAELFPGIKMLFLSGYTDDAVVRHGIMEGEVVFLQKPFTPSSLTAKVREVLDGG